MKVKAGPDPRQSGRVQGVSAGCVADNVSDIERRIPNSACCIKLDVEVTCEERVIRRSDELKSWGEGRGGGGGGERRGRAVDGSAVWRG